MTGWIADLQRHAAAGRPAAVVTILEVRGSAPREAGCKMVVTANDFNGTIGGGQLERMALDIARRMLAEAGGSNPPPLVREFPLGPSLGQCCGGMVSLLFETVLPPALHIGLFGAGHVGRAFARVMGDVDCRIDWYDSRADAFPDEIPGNARAAAPLQPVQEIASLPIGSYVLIMTHDHGLDLDLVEAALRRGVFPYVGLIGSATKRARFLKRLKERGIGLAALAQLVCPIGNPEILSKHPAEIAIGTAAQLLSLHRAAMASAQSSAGTIGSDQTNVIDAVSRLQCQTCAIPC